MYTARTLALVLVVACGGAASSTEPPPPGDDVDAAGLPDRPYAVVASAQLCKLLADRNNTDPTPNDVQHRANVFGADLGIPVVHDNTLYIMFGDTIGFAGIWPPSESHPDAVGFARPTAAEIAAAPQRLCSELGILTLPPAQSIGPNVDPTVAADFAAAAVAAPAGHDLGEFVHNPAGGGASTFAFLPGDFEVPSGAFASGDSIYVFNTTVVSRAQPAMIASYLARWQNPTKTGTPSYQILYAVDGPNGPLHGNFINVAAEVSGEYVYLFGTGDYRKSPISVARKRLDALATPGNFEELGTIIPTAGYGETSVRYFPEVDRWVILAEELTPGSNRIVAYTAREPTGPWSDPIVVHDMADPAFTGQYCCTVDDDCRGTQMFDCDRTGFYGSYLFPSVRVDGGAFTVTYTLSSFAPYNVALFEATFAPAP